MEIKKIQKNIYKKLFEIGIVYCTKRIREAVRAVLILFFISKADNIEVLKTDDY
jgi:hypothetical protein